MPTIYPKSSPSQVMGLLVLLSTHKGAEDVALLADDLDLEIDEILPSLDFAKALGFLTVADGRATLTELGRKMLAVNIRERKAILRDQLRTTTLYKTLIGVLERAPDHKLTEEEMVRLIAFTTAPADEAVQNIVNWGRFAGLFRYDSETRILTASRSPRAARPSTTGPRGPPPGGAVEAPPATRRAPPAASEGREQSMVPAPGVT